MTYPVFSGGINDAYASQYPIQRSVRFNRASVAYFNRTFGTPTNATVYTFSAWVKRGDIGNIRALLGTSLTHYIAFSATDTVRISAGGTVLSSIAVFRDTAAWYHVVYTRSGTTNTVYVNNVQVLTGPASPTMGTAIAHNVGSGGAGISTYDGLMAHVYFVDGQVLTPSSFGAYSAGTSVWQPIAYTGTYGNNGFFLNFQDNSSNTATTIGKDSSGNGNNFTPNNISVTAGVTYDSMIDVPTPTSSIQCNYPAINGLSTVTTSVVTGGGLQTTSAAAHVLVTTMRMDTGSFYWEINFSAAIAAQIVGVYKTAATTVTVTPTTNTIGVRFNATAGTLDYTTDGTSYTSIATGLTGGGYFPYAASATNNKVIYVNFGQRPFTYAIPTGYGVLNSFSLAAPVPNSAKAFAVTLYTGNGTTQTISNARNGASFYPDIILPKSRSTTGSQYLYDSVRGATKELIINSTASQTTGANSVTAISSTGFSLGSGFQNNITTTYAAFQWNAGNGISTWNFDGSLTRTATMTIASPCVVTLSTNGFTAGQAVQFTTTGALPTGITAGVTYYAGNILTNTTFNLYDTEANAIAGGSTGRIDTSGTQSGTQTCEHASLISVNQTTGTSVVRYVGKGGSTTVGHGLNAAPEFIIIKSTTLTSNWPVYHSYVPSNSYLLLNATNIATADGTYWNSTTPTSSVFSLGTNAVVNTNGATFIAYCFRSVPGYSSFGGYTGDGGTLFTYTGFLPRYVIIKRTSVASQSWITLNGSSQTFNVEGPYFFLDNGNAEGATTTLVDFLSNGFKQRSNNANTNVSGSNYAYMAWAESPFKYSLAR